MALGTTGAILLGLGAAGAGYAATKSASRSSAPSSPAPMPQAPKAEQATQAGADTARRRRKTVSQTVYSSPLGIAGQANVARAGLKSKLGE